jgi:signal peptidase I
VGPEISEPPAGSVPPESVEPEPVEPVAVDPEHEARATPSKARAKASRWELPVLVLIAMVVAITVKTFLFQPFYIPSESMEQTLHGCAGCSGDRVLVNKPVYHLRDPHPGDIVVFKAPTSWDDEVQFRKQYNPAVGAVRWFGQLLGVIPPDEKDLIKRVIATGGETVKCCDSQGRVQISDSGPNGPWRSLDEPYIFNDGTGPPTAPFGPVTVPEGRLWVMGDHRNDSADSRAHCDTPTTPALPGASGCNPVSSTVPVSAVIGKAVLIVWPPSRWTTLGTPPTFAAAAGAGLPVLSGLAVIAPIGLIRRSRRRRARCRLISG